MTILRPRRVALLAALRSLFAGASSPALAGSGGSTAPGQGTSPAGYGVTTSPQTAGAQPTTGDGTIAGTGGGIVGTKLKFKGVANGAREGDTISLQAQGGDGAWAEI